MRLVLAVLAIHLLLVPTLFGGLLYMVKNGYQEQFVDDARSQAFLLSNLANQNMQPAAIGRLIDEAVLNGKIVYAQFIDPKNRTIYAHNQIKHKFDFAEDFFFGEHGDNIYFISLPIISKKKFYSMRLGFDESRTLNQINMAYTRGIYLALAYVILTFSLLAFVIPQLNRMRQEIVRQAGVLEYQSLHDSLTGLPNRSLFEIRVRQASAGINCVENQCFALLLMDLNRFKQVNDTLGHCTGDAVLVETGYRLRQVVRNSDTVVRLGGDEFAIYLPGSELSGATAVAKKFMEIMKEPFNIDPHCLHIGASIGIVLSPLHGHDVKTLMRHVDVAMYDAKRTHADFRVYEESLDKDAMRRMNITRDLREGLGRGEMHMLYQPQMRLADGQIDSAEALIRWNHPKHGILLPEAFIPIAEDSGLINKLTTWVLRETVRQISNWNRAGVKLKIAVNLSPLNLQETNLPTKLKKLLQEYAVQAEQLELEITEKAIFVDFDKTVDNLKRIHAMGVSLAIDDFGTGYYSLTHLKHLPIAKIKIDCSFIKNICNDINNASIVHTLVDLAHVFGLQVVAEGAENKHTLETLKKLNCDMAQGFVIAKPMPAKAIEHYFRTATQPPDISPTCHDKQKQQLG